MAREALRALTVYDPELVEQPVVRADIDGLAELRRGSTIPIMADESLFDDHDALRLVAANACDYFNIKLAKAAGIWTALKINAIGEAAHIPCMVGCMTDTGVAIAAAVHLASARANIMIPPWPVCCFGRTAARPASRIDPGLPGYSRLSGPAARQGSCCGATPQSAPHVSGALSPARTSDVA